MQEYFPFIKKNKKEWEPEYLYIEEYIPEKEVFKREKEPEENDGIIIIQL